MLPASVMVTSLPSFPLISRRRIQLCTFLDQYGSVLVETSLLPSVLLLLSPVAMECDGALCLSLGVVAFHKFLSCICDYKCYQHKKFIGYFVIHSCIIASNVCKKITALVENVKDKTHSFTYINEFLKTRCTIQLVVIL